MKVSTSAINVLTVDVEDYFQVENFAGAVKRSEWDGYESRVVKNTLRILEILEDADTRATFFVLGWVGEKFPGLVKLIRVSGHEVASHGYSHRLIYNQTPEDFRSDLRLAKSILEDAAQEPVIGYRAPSYSITRKSVWALDILMEEGMKYDSSLFPIYHDRGGLPEAGRFPYKIHNHKNYLWEFPITTAKIFNQNMPFSGGGYFRLLPYTIIRHWMEAINKEDHPTIVYIHPWEIDPAQPRIKAGYLNSARHYVNIARTEDKLRRLLRDFDFVPMGKLLQHKETS